MRKGIVALLVVAMVGLTACIGNASPFGDNPDRYFKQPKVVDGNIFYIDRQSIRHHADNHTNYIGVVELNPSGELFKTSCTVIPSDKIPLFVVSFVTLDCANAKFKTSKMAILGVSRTDLDASNPGILWTMDSPADDWQVLPDGIEKGVKAVLCGPSF